MSVNIKRNGTLQKIADQTLIFDANSAETRSGAITVPAINEINGNQSVQVVFSSPMPDTNYEVIIDEGIDTWAHLTATVTNKTTTGFTLLVVTLVPNMPQLNFHYTAFKLVTLEGYSSVQNKINNPDSSPTQNSTNLVTSGGVYEAIANSASSFIGTQEEWEALTVAQQSQYEIVYITDDEAADGYFTPTTISTTGTTVSQGSATIDSLNCIRSGNIVTISGALDAATLTNGSGTTTILTLPNTIPATMILTTGVMGYWGSGVDETGYCQINGRTLKFFSNASNASVSNMYVRFSVTYICQ